MEEYIFKGCSVSHSRIDKISQKIYNSGIQLRNFEMSSYALYFAIKYDFAINNISIDDIISSDDCILMLLAYVYFKKNRDRDSLRKLKEIAKFLAGSDFNNYWLFVYEVLPQSELHDDWKVMKKAKVSFIKI